MSKEIKEIEGKIKDQEALIGNELIPEKIKDKAKKIKADLEKKMKALELAAKRGGEKVKKEVEKEIEKIEGKEPEKKPEEKKPAKKKRKPSAAPTESFELKVDGKVIKFTDLKSKEACEKAIAAVRARRKEQVDHKKATSDGKKRAATKPVTQKVTDGLITATKRAVANIPATRIKKHPEEVKKAIDELEKAFGTLFDKLENLLGKKIPKAQRDSIMGILTRVENKVEEGESKKEAATSRTKKEEGGLADDNFNSDSWSYTNFM
jgi:hypothetical protein